MYIKMVCKRNGTCKCIRCKKEIIVGESFYGDALMEGWPFCDEICEECFKEEVNHDKTKS